MLYALFAVAIAFSAAVGVGLAENGGSAWTVLTVTVVAVVTMQLAFIATAVLRG